ncbi:MAG: hypothetical protein JWP87_3186 [Labilithrix sp.]|nr:hypothetical protein [Labilithrix sp.]
MTREQFLECAADIYDVWQNGKPGAHLTVIDGGRSKEG